MSTKTNNLIYLQDPTPYRPLPKNKRGRKPTKLKTDEPSIRIDAWTAGQSDDAWHIVRLRSSTRGELIVQVLHQNVWL